MSRLACLLRYWEQPGADEAQRRADELAAPVRSPLDKGPDAQAFDEAAAGVRRQIERTVEARVEFIRTCPRSQQAPEPAVEQLDAELRAHPLAGALSAWADFIFADEEGHRGAPGRPERSPPGRAT